MEDDGGGGLRLGKKASDKDGEVDFKTKSGTAWSHSFLNQKPWHPLSYPNQRRKWIAEQTQAQKQRRAEEVAREYSQEQEFLRQTALISKEQKEKMEMMRAVSFMYVKPPGYDPESAKAAEMSSNKKKTDDEIASEDPSAHEASSSMKVQKKKKPTDVFGRVLPTEEQFEVLKNAPKLDTGVAGRSKPFGVEIRNVKCLRCGNFGHQSGDRECPLKDAVMPNEENRLKREDPLTAIMAQTDSIEPLKWELKQQPGMSPPHGGFDRDDPNQQIVAGEIFDEYGGFLGEAMPDLLTKFNSSKKTKKKSKHQKRSSGSSSDDDRRRSSGHEKKKRKKKKKKKKKKERKRSESSSSEESDRRHSKMTRRREDNRPLADSDLDSSELPRRAEERRHQQKTSKSENLERKHSKKTSRREHRHRRFEDSDSDELPSRESHRHHSCHRRQEELHSHRRRDKQSRDQGT